MNIHATTKSDGLEFSIWVIQVLQNAKNFGYNIDTERNGKALRDFYNSDYSAEDAWQEIFEES